MLYELIYSSRATPALLPGDVAKILVVARRNNAARGVSGMLLFDAGSFLQVLEGEQADVEHVYEHVCRDPRHEGVVILKRGPIEKRGFAEWSMGLVMLSPEVRALPGLSDFLRTGIMSLEGGSTTTARVLQGFRDGAYRRHVS